MKQLHHSQEALIEFPDGVNLSGTLTIPENAVKLVIFAHGSGSGRFSPRNQFVARFLNDQGMATLLLDLLTPEEEAVDEITREYRFNIPLLADRLVATAHWARSNTSTNTLKISYFGASTGAAAALIAAAKEGNIIADIVSRGGRPDLAEAVLPTIKTPTLLIVGGDDGDVITLNKQAYDLLAGEKGIEIVPGATHLFEEPGTLDAVAQLAAVWFKKH